MPWVAAVAAVVGAVISSDSSRHASNTAADAQRGAAQGGIDEQAYEFDAIKEMLKPYMAAGPGALTGQQDLLGLNGSSAQSSAIDGIQNSPQFAAMAKQGENSILQNASATGGLRGGNTEAALAQFRPQLLNQLIDQQYQRLGGLTTLGQNSSAMVGTAGQNTANSISQLLAQQGAATAGSALAGGRSNAQLINGISSAIGANSSSSSSSSSGGGFGGLFGGGGGGDGGGPTSGFTNGGFSGGAF